jgi:hypothetical protein
VALLSYVAMATVITARNTAQDRAAGVCKDLDGILDLGDKDLPVGVKASDLRLCNGHPNGVNITFDPAQGASLAPFQAVDALPLSLANTNVALKTEENNPLVARACYKDAQYGCSGGYCWKQCGNVQRGEWCWTACKF